MKYTPKELQGNVNVSATSPLKEFFLLLGGAVGILIVVYLVLGFTVDIVVTNLPPGIEQYLGNLYAQAFADEEQTAAGIYLQTLLDDLAKELPQKSGPYYIHLVPFSQANAVALPGGHILILSALLVKLDSENELAFILAHELGHFAHRDHLRGLGRALVLTVISEALFGQDNPVTNFLGNSLFAVEMKFSQRQETQADLFALELLHKRYGHIGGATDFFEKIAEEDTQGRLAYYFATHPYPEDRIKDLQEEIRKRAYLIKELLPLDETIRTLPAVQTPEDISLKDIFKRK